LFKNERIEDTINQESKEKTSFFFHRATAKKKTATTNEKEEERNKQKKLRPICIFQEDFTFFFVLNFSKQYNDKTTKKKKSIH